MKLSRFEEALHDPSSWVLLAANFVPFFGVLFWGWEVFPLMLLFWMENVVVGVFNVLRILTASSSVGIWLFKIFMVPFFIVHYGIFTAVHGVFVFVLFGGGMAGAEQKQWGFWEVFTDYHIGWALLALIISHGFDFVYNYLGKGEFRTVTPQILMTKPYKRVIVLHLVIIFGGFIIMLLGSPALALLLLIVLKILMDLYGHRWEHDIDPVGEMDLGGFDFDGD